MKINTKVRYGLRTLIELGLKRNKDGMLQKDIADNQEISKKYLDPIIASLKTAGLIVNVGGKKSGYKLNRPPSKIKILDIYKAFESGPYVVNCLCDPKICHRVSSCTAYHYWTGLNNAIVNHMNKTTLESLIRQTEKVEAALRPKEKTSAKRNPIKKAK